MQDSTGKSYYVDGYDNSGNPIVRLANTVPQNRSLWLNYNPKGWQDAEISFALNNKYFGVFRNFTTPFEFVKDGADILRYLFYAKGFNEKVYLVILEHNGTTDTYEPFYKGQIDLTQLTDKAIEGCECNMIEGDLLYYLLKNDSINYEVPCNPTNPDAIQIYFDGVELFDKYNFGFVPIVAAGVAYNTHAVPIYFKNNEGDSVGIIHGDQQYEEINNASALPLVAFNNYADTSSNYLFSSVKTLTNVRIKGSVTVHTPTNNRQYYLYAYLNGGFSVVLANGVFIAGGTSLTITFDQTITLGAEGKIFLLSYWNGTTAGDIEYIDGEFSIDFKSINDPSYAYAIPPLKLLQYLVDKMSDGKYTAQSSFLATNTGIPVTSGEALRELKDANGNLNGVLKTSFEDFYTSYNVIYKLGIKIVNNVLYMELREDFLVQTTILNSGECSDFIITPARDYFFNTIKVGYPPQQYDERNGRNEFNSTNEFSVPIVAEKKELNLVSKYRADCYGIEFIRGKLNNKDTTDNKGDNDTFFVNVVPGPLETYTAGATSGTYLTADLAFSTFAGTIFTPQSSNEHLVYGGNADPSVHFALHFVGTNTSGATIRIDILKNGITFGMVSGASGATLVLNATTPLLPTDFISLFLTQSSYGSDVTVSSLSLVATQSMPNVYNLRREAYSSITGVPTNTVFNIAELTPQRILKNRWGNWIRSVLFQYGGEFIIFQTADKNKELSTTLNGVTYSEKADTRIGALAPPLFYPFIFSMKTKVPNTFLGIMNASTNGQVQSDYVGKSFYGFPVNMTVKPVYNEAQEWKQLASPANNISDLLNLEPLLINDDNMATYRLSFAHLCPLQKVPIGNIILPQYNTVHMDAGFWHEQITNYIQRMPYMQKWQTNDIIKLQCYTNDLGPVQEDIFDCHGLQIDTISYQQIATNAFQAPYQLYEANINLQNYPPGVYYTITTAGISAATVQFISEGIDLREVHPTTKLFNYTHSKNKLSTVFTTGYNPDFRIEADIKDFEPGAHYSSYEDEPADIELIEGIPFRKFKLGIGKGTTGMPPYMIDKLNRVMVLDTVLIDGKRFTRELDAQFEPESVAGVPGKYWTLPIREGFNRQASTLGTDGNLEKTALVAYNIDTKLFGDLSGQVSSNVIQITREENIQ